MQPSWAEGQALDVLALSRCSRNGSVCCEALGMRPGTQQVLSRGAFLAGPLAHVPRPHEVPGKKLFHSPCEARGACTVRSTRWASVGYSVQPSAGVSTRWALARRVVRSRHPACGGVHAPQSP